jgi:hypothetical protein
MLAIPVGRVPTTGTGVAMSRGAGAAGHRRPLARTAAFPGCVGFIELERLWGRWVR